MSAKFKKSYTYYPNGVQGLNKSCCRQAPGLAIGTDKTTAKTSNTFSIRYSPSIYQPAIFSAAKTTADCPALTTSDAGVTPIADGYSRVYTLLGVASESTGAITLSWVNSDDIDTHRGPLNESDINYGDGTKAIIGSVYIKWEPNTGASFTPGTTLLDAAGATTSYGDAYGYVIA